MAENEEKAKPTNGAGTSKKDRIRFHYIKSPAFHTVHADGGIGGLTPGADFHLALYAERFAIPTSSEHVLTTTGPGKEIVEARVVRDGVVRELQVDVVFDYRAAVMLRAWLDRNIKLWEKVATEQAETGAAVVPRAEKEDKE